MSAIDVLSYGTIGLDRVYSIPHWPNSDISTHTSQVSEHLGGKASNAAVFLGGWGLRVAPIGTVLGTDSVGISVRRLLQASRGIQLTYVEQRPGLDSMYCLIFVTPTGERAIVGVNTDGHPCTRLTKDMVVHANCLTLDLYGDKDRVDAARLANQHGIPVVVGDLRRADHRVLPYSNIAISSAAEIRQEYPGRDISDFALEVNSNGPDCVVVTDGVNPVLLATRDQPAERLLPPVVDVVDTTGAGDALRAGVVYGLLKGMSSSDYVKFGIASGALAITKVGACTQPPSLEEVTNLARMVMTA